MLWCRVSDWRLSRPLGPDGVPCTSRTLRSASHSYLYCQEGVGIPMDTPSWDITPGSYWLPCYPGHADHAWLAKWPMRGHPDLMFTHVTVQHAMHPVHVPWSWCSYWWIGMVVPVCTSSPDPSNRKVSDWWTAGSDSECIMHTRYNWQTNILYIPPISTTRYNNRIYPDEML